MDNLIVRCNECNALLDYIVDENEISIISCENCLRVAKDTAHVKGYDERVRDDRREKDD